MSLSVSARARAEVHATALALLLLLPLACSGTRPTNLGVQNALLAPCPDTPNCVSSLELDPPHAIEPLTFRGSPTEAWDALLDAVAAMPRTEVRAERPGYLYAECRSLIMRFVDDLELYLPPGGQIIHVRSASRVGRSDLGVNRARVEELREAFEARLDALGEGPAPAPADPEQT